MNRNRRRAAFTLVEILATLAFLSLVIPVAVRAIQVATRAGEVSERELIAAQLGENRLSELMLAQAWMTAESRGAFEGQPDYRWELKKGDWQSGAMTELTLNVYFQVQAREQNLQMSTLVSSSLTQQTTQK